MRGASLRRADGRLELSGADGVLPQAHRGLCASAGAAVGLQRLPRFRAVVGDEERRDSPVRARARTHESHG